MATRIDNTDGIRMVLCETCYGKFFPQDLPADTKSAPADTRKGLTPGAKGGGNSRRAAAMCEARVDCDAAADVVQNIEYQDKKGQRRIMQWFYCEFCCASDGTQKVKARTWIYCEYAGGHDPAVEAEYLVPRFGEQTGYCGECYRKYRAVIVLRDAGVEVVRDGLASEMIDPDDAYLTGREVIFRWAETLRETRRIGLPPVAMLENRPAGLLRFDERRTDKEILKIWATSLGMSYAPDTPFILEMRTRRLVSEVKE